MKSYFNDLQFWIMAKRRILYNDSHAFSPQNYSLELITKGEITLSKNGKKILLKGPVLFWMKPENEYCFSYEEFPPEKFCEHLYMDYCGSRAERITAFLEETFPRGYAVPEDGNAVKELMEELLRYHRMDPKRYHARMVLLVERLMGCLEEDLRQKDHGALPDPYGLEKEAENIRSDPFRSFDFQELAKKKNISYDHFRTLFRKRFDSSPNNYVLHQRMLRASEMLKNSRIRIKEVMVACNYNSFMEFSRTFKRHMGTSPRNYRERYWKEQEEGK